MVLRIQRGMPLAESILAAGTMEVHPGAGLGKQTVGVYKPVGIRYMY